MPSWAASSDGKLQIFFLSEDDLKDFIDKVVIPVARQYGLEVKIEKAKNTKIQIVRT